MATAMQATKRAANSYLFQDLRGRSRMNRTRVTRTPKTKVWENRNFSAVPDFSRFAQFLRERALKKIFDVLALLRAIGKAWIAFQGFLSTYPIVVVSLNSNNIPETVMMLRSMALCVLNKGDWSLGRSSHVFITLTDKLPYSPPFSRYFALPAW